MIILDVTDAMVRKCKNVSIFIDKKMRERRIEHDKFIIMLDDNTPFQGDEQVKIICKSDYEQFRNIVKTLEIERNSLKEQNIELKTTIEVQEKLIDKIEKFKTIKDDKSPYKGLFKGLF